MSPIARQPDAVRASEANLSAPALSAPDCRSCAACCRDASDGRVLVSAEDIIRWKRTNRADLIDSLVPGHFDQMGFPAEAAGACSHLGHAGAPNDCSIYDTRGESCRALEPGSRQCLTYRWARGLR